MRVQIQGRLNEETGHIEGYIVFPPEVLSAVGWSYETEVVITIRGPELVIQRAKLDQKVASNA